MEAKSPQRTFLSISSVIHKYGFLISFQKLFRSSRYQKMIANSAQIQFTADGQGSSDVELGPGDEPNRATGFGKRYQPLTSLCNIMGNQRLAFIPKLSQLDQQRGAILAIMATAAWRSGYI